MNDASRIHCVLGEYPAPLPRRKSVPRSRPLTLHRAPLTDRGLQRAFVEARLQPSQWDHLSHLRIGWLALDQAAFRVALRALRNGIRGLNRANGLLTGYHETLTMAWLRVIDAAMGQHRGVHSLDFVVRHPALHDPRYLRKYYRPHHLRRAEARSRFLPADLTPLPLGPRYAVAVATPQRLTQPA